MKRIAKRKNNNYKKKLARLDDRCKESNKETRESACESKVIKNVTRDHSWISRILAGIRNKKQKRKKLESTGFIMLLII